MPITKSAIKRLKQSQGRNLRNRAEKSRLRSTIKKVRSAIEEKEKAAAQTALSQAIPVVDKAADKGIMHKNAASRFKSRLSRQVNALPAV